MNELLGPINREQVQSKLTRIEPEFNVADSIAEELSLTVYDQPEAATAVGKRLAMWQSGLTEVDKPIGVLFFAGPPGVGKTEMAHATAEWFGGENRLLRLDMSDYQQEHTSQKLTGSPPGYVGYNEEPALPHDVINDPNTPTVVLLDEIEKAHPAVLRQLLSAFDKGELNARNGSKGFETLDFSRTLFIMTSNIASQEVVQIEKNGSKRIGFGHDGTEVRDDEIQKVVKDAMKAKFPPEFLDRVDQFVRFKPIESDSTRLAILTKFIGEVNQQFQDRWAGDAPFLDLTREARQAIIDKKDDKGGRGIKREFHQLVISQLPNVMMGMDYHRRPFVADIEDGKTVWYTDVRNPQTEEVHIGNRRPTGEGKKIPEQPKLIGSGLDDREGDRTGSVGGDEAPPPEEEDEEVEDPTIDHDIAENGGDLRFYAPNTGDNWPVVDLVIRIREAGRQDLVQQVEGLPLRKQ